MLTDNGIQFTGRAKNIYALHYILDRVCDENGIEHRLTKPYHPWTNGHVNISSIRVHQHGANGSKKGDPVALSAIVSNRLPGNTWVDRGAV